MQTDASLAAIDVQVAVQTGVGVCVTMPCATAPRLNWIWNVVVSSARVSAR